MSICCYIINIFFPHVYIYCPLSVAFQLPPGMAQPLYSQALPANMQFRQDDEQKSQISWGLFAAGWWCTCCCGCPVWICSFPVPVFLYYGIPAQNRAQYSRTKLPAMLSACSCACCMCIFCVLPLLMFIMTAVIPGSTEECVSILGPLYRTFRQMAYFLPKNVCHL